MKPTDVCMISKFEASWAALSDAVRERRVERTSKTKAWFVIHVATDMTAKPMRADVRMSRANCSRIGMRILNCRKGQASLVRRMKNCVVLVLVSGSPSS